MIKNKIMYMSTPVAFIIFNRPDLTQIVFDEIRKAKPKQLFIIADGPRNATELIECDAARHVIDQVDWDCEIHKNYSDINRGCRECVSSGLTWVFEHVEEAIILEDDCVPSSSFFAFCEILLKRYRHDKRIMAISGNNFQDGQWRGDGTYYFSNYPHCWGWATWSRAWSLYDKNLDRWKVFRNVNGLDSIFRDNREVQYWKGVLDKLYSQGQPNSWAYVWGLTCWQNNGLSILPNVNLVKNIGFDDRSTHTRKKSRLSHIPVGNLDEIVHPACVVRNTHADIYTFETYFLPTILRRFFVKFKAAFLNLS